MTGESDTYGQKTLQRKSRNALLETSNASAAPPIVHEVLHAPGQPLDVSTRAFMEPRFGHNFSNVRVHTDAKAAKSTNEVNALAYTVGRDIVFARGQYMPQTYEGQKTLAHELTHTIQQSGSPRYLPERLGITNPQDASEQEAGAVADAVMRGTAPSTVEHKDSVIARAPVPTTPPPPPALPKKTVTINPTILSGGSLSVSSALDYANKKVYNQANIEIKKGKETTCDEPTSKKILGDDLILDEYSDATKPTVEEKALFAENQTTGAVTIYFVKGLSQKSTGESFIPVRKVGFVGSAVGNSGNDATVSHELGHCLLDIPGYHNPDSDYVMYEASSPTKYKLSDTEIETIRKSPFAT